MKHFIQYFPVWHCGSCGRAYSSLENYCFFCAKRESKKEPMPPRHQYRDLPTQPVGREFYLASIPLDYFER